MRKFTYHVPEGTYTVDEKYIINTFFHFWREKMKKAGKTELINKENCIEDWKVIHWAWETTFDH